jgi:hypothetical protein
MIAQFSHSASVFFLNSNSAEMAQSGEVSASLRACACRRSQAERHALFHAGIRKADYARALARAFRSGWARVADFPRETGPLHPSRC